MLIWTTGRVVRVADGLTDKRSSRGKKVLPAGMVLWAWDADPEFGESAGEKWLAFCCPTSGTRHASCSMAGGTTRASSPLRRQRVMRAARAGDACG